VPMLADAIPYFIECVTGIVDDDADGRRHSDALARRIAPVASLGERMKPKVLLMGALLLTVGACATAQQSADQDNAACRSYGFAAGSQGYAQGRMTLDRDRQQRRDAAVDAMSSSLQNVQEGYARSAAQAGAQLNAPQPLPTTHCLDGSIRLGYGPQCLANNVAVQLA
jgi:hypothetical protein